MTKISRRGNHRQGVAELGLRILVHSSGSLVAGFLPPFHLLVMETLLLLFFSSLVAAVLAMLGWYQGGKSPARPV
jgi:hypothetical protein